jgi:hypothetical protein
MNDFGKNRGEIAHTSFYGTQYQSNPKNEYDNIFRLLEGLEALDKVLATFLEDI